MKSFPFYIHIRTQDYTSFIFCLLRAGGERRREPLLPIARNFLLERKIVGYNSRIKWTLDEIVKFSLSLTHKVEFL